MSDTAQGYVGEAPPDNVVGLAVAYANKSGCAKSHRGVALYHAPHLPKGWLEGRPWLPIAACNAPPWPFRCGRNNAHMPKSYRDGVCPDHCSKLAVHAEQAVLIKAMKEGMPINRVAVMVHVKTVGGKLVHSGGPSCWQCSKLMVEAGVLGIWLYHEEGWTFYNRTRFHRLTIEACGLNEVST